MFNKVVYIIFVFILLLLWACTSKPAPVATEAKKAPEVIASTKEKTGWEAEWETVQKEARKEGKVILYTTAGTELTGAFAEVMKEYGFNFESVSGRGTEIAEKILRERRAGIYNVDLYMTGLNTFVTTLKPVGALAPLEPLLLLPEVKDPKVWYKGELPFADKERKIIVFEAYVDQGIHINTDIVKPGDINLMQDLLSPMWKGKIIMDDPTVAGRGQNWMTVTALKLGEDYVRQLAKQEPLLTRDRRLLIDWIAKGRYSIGVGVYPDQYQEYKRAGAAVNNLPLKEVSYLLGGIAYLSLMDKSPNPNAAKVFLNWLLSKKGQILWQEIRNTQSSRIDTPVDHLIKTEQPLRMPNVDYYDNRSEEWQLEVRPKGDKIVVDTFKTLLK